MGLALRKELHLPLPLCKHVIKLILGHRISWTDFDDMDPQIFDRFIELHRFLDDPNAPGSLEDLAIDFEVQLLPEEGGQCVSGSEERYVTSSNLNHFCQFYCEQRMQKCRTACSAIRKGLLRVLPLNALQSMNAEHFYDLLVGKTSELNSTSLRESILILDRRCNPDGRCISDFHQMLWNALDKFDEGTLREFLQFATGQRHLSPQRTEASIKIQVFDQSDKLPVSRSCYSTLEVPFYCTEEMLIKKLRLAIPELFFSLD